METNGLSPTLFSAVLVSQHSIGAGSAPVIGQAIIAMGSPIFETKKTRARISGIALDFEFFAILPIKRRSMLVNSHSPKNYAS